MNFVSEKYMSNRGWNGRFLFEVVGVYIYVRGKNWILVWKMNL